MDYLSIITGIAILAFLLFYLAFNIEKDHPFLKILTIFAGVFILIFIPQVAIEADKDCAVITNGSYICYNSNGTQIFGEGGDYEQRNIGVNFHSAYLWFIRIFIGYILIYYSWYVLKWMIGIVNKKKYKWRKIGGQ